MVPRVLTSASLSNSSIEASAIGLLESVPICTTTKVRSQNGPTTAIRGEVHPSAVDAIINPAKLLDSGIYHSLYTLHISDIDADSEAAVVRVRRQTLALFSCVASTTYVQVCKNDTRRSSFREGQGSFPSDATCCLIVRDGQSAHCAIGKSSVRTPVMRAIPCTPLKAILIPWTCRCAQMKSQKRL